MKKRKLLISFMAVVGLGSFAPMPQNTHAVVLSENTPNIACIETLQEHFKNAESNIDGNSRDVIIVPGFMGGELTMQPLTSALKAKGYSTHDWGAGVNLGADATRADKFEQTLLSIYKTNGQKPVALVGYSLGGIYARELARKYPDKVGNVITLASPINMNLHGVDKISIAYGGDGDISKPIDVPTSSFLSESDWMVTWKDALNADKTLAENVVVKPGHVRVAFVNSVHNMVAERLAQPSNAWTSLQQKYCHSAK